VINLLFILAAAADVNDYHCKSRRMWCATAHLSWLHQKLWRL